MTKKDRTIKDLKQALDLLDEILLDTENIYNNDKIIKIYHNICISIARLKNEK